MNSFASRRQITQKKKKKKKKRESRDSMDVNNSSGNSFCFKHGMKHTHMPFAYDVLDVDLILCPFLRSAPKINMFSSTKAAAVPTGELSQMK